MGSVAYPSTFMELRWVTTRTKKDKNNINNPKELNLKPAATIPVYISTNPSDINPPELRELFTVCNHSCYRFPRMLTSRDIYNISALCSEDERITMSAGPSIGGSIEPGRQISNRVGAGTHS
ncbi:hypothetical protein Q3G72_023011 [Acer saccharum]|nr:hypothetical protein Q3G72_023011 [Acer saccharum]